MNRRRKGEENPTIECACGCGKTLKKYNKWGRPKRFIRGHKTTVSDIIYLEMAKKRFWANVNKGVENECWEWQRSCQRGGYGYCRIKGMPTSRTHRLAWIFTYGEIPKGLYACHRCDNPPCCNPAHLFLGTQKDNMADSALKGRQGVKLSEEDIVEIRKQYATGDFSQRKIAKQFNINRQNASKIISGEQWACVSYLPSNGYKKMRTKLSDNDIVSIRKQYEQGGITNKEISRIYQVAVNTISNITSMRTRREREK